MKCQKCNCTLSPDEKDQILQALAEGIKNPGIYCNDCIEEISESDDFDDDSDDDYF